MKWYMLKPESVQENETHKIIWDFELQTDHSIQTRKDMFLIKKNRICHLMDFVVPVNHIVKMKKKTKR